MNTLEAIAKRVSIRAYQSEQIPEEALQTILKAGMAAPVASAQYDSLHITVVQDAELLHKIAEETNEFIAKMIGKRMDKNFGAPTMVFVSAKPGMMPGVDHANVATVLENMVLAATDLGIDSIIWGGAAVAVSQNEELRSKLGIPVGFNTPLCASFGYAAAPEPAKEHTISVNRV